jgi:hypothetical protein
MTHTHIFHLSCIDFALGQTALLASGFELSNHDRPSRFTASDVPIGIQSATLKPKSLHEFSASFQMEV